MLIIRIWKGKELQITIFSPALHFTPPDKTREF